MADKETPSSIFDISQLRTPIQISGKPVEQVLSSIHYGSPELRCLLLDECDLIFECKVCRALFRDLPNFISHKRVYCTNSSMENRHVTIASLPEEKVVVIQPQAPEETEKQAPSSNRQLRQQPKAQRPNLEDTIMRIQSGELGRSHAYQVYTEAAEKLQKQKEGMKVATIRTTNIPTNKNAVFIDVNMASVNIHERQQQAGVGSYDQNRNDTSVSVAKRKTGERLESTRNMRKSVKQEKHSSEPQKLLLEQLKEIQQKRVKSAPQNKESHKNSTPPAVNENLQKPVANTSTIKVQKKVPDSAGRKLAVSDNVQNVLDNEKTPLVNLKNAEKVSNSLVKRHVDSKTHPKTVDKNQLHTFSAITAMKTRKRFAEQSLICSKCSAVFATRKSLSFHNKIHHSTKRTFYPCPYCQSVFYYFYGITRHLFINHDKTLEEVNAMRKQLRERSFTKPLCAPSLSETRGVVSGSSRRTRMLARNSVASALQSAGSSREVLSVLSDRQPPKRGSGGHEITSSESPSKTAQSKHAQLDVSHGENQQTPQLSGGAADESNDDIEEESRSLRLKNKQHKATEGSSKANDLNSQANSQAERVAATSSQTKTSTMSRHKESTSYVCTRCRRSFRRKISCKNHMKGCNVVSRRSLKRLRSQSRGHKDKQGLTGATASMNMKTVKLKRGHPSSSNEVKSKITQSVELISGTKGSARKDVVAITSTKAIVYQIIPIDSRNTKMSSGNSTSSMSRRSSSMDRVTNHDEPRNRSHDRNSAGRDQRDSSVESTQSNIEGKSPRSRRNVLSRYATPMQASKSPAKFDILMTNTGSDIDSEFSASDILPQVNANGVKPDLSGKILSCTGDKASRDCSEERDFKLEIKSTVLSGNQTRNLETTQAGAAPTSSRGKSSSTNQQLDVLGCDDKKSTTAITPETSSATLMPEKCKKSPETLNLPQINPEHSPGKSYLSSSSLNISSSSDAHVFPHKQPGSAGRSLLFQIMSSGSVPKTEASSPESELPKNELSMPSNNSCENKTAKPDSLNAEKDVLGASLRKDPWKLQKGVTDLADLEYQSVWENSEIFKSSMMDKKTQAKKKSVKLMELKSEFSIGDFSGQTVECLDIKASEISSDNAAVKTSPGNPIQIKNIKPLNLQEPAVVSSLSERPKRKRKVPSRNRDAEEMLSKILSHSNQTVPGKRRKISPEPKPPVMSKQKLKTDGIINDTTSVTAAHGGKETRLKGMETPDEKKDKNEVEMIHEDDISELGDKVDNEELGKVKGRFVSNRMYVLEKFGSKRKRLKCYDQVKVFKLIDEENLKCLECGESCTQVSNLRRHVIRQHLKWSRFKCKLCKFDSYDRSECTTHLIRGHRNVAINLRNVNRYIIDLVKKGSHARSIKKIQTIKVKQAQNQEENIYARPMVKKVMRLPQRTKEESVSKPERHPVSENTEVKNLDLQSQTRSKEQTLTPSHDALEVKPGMVVQDPKPVAVVVTLSRKQINTLTSSSKGRLSEQSPQQQVSKPALAQQQVSKPALAQQQVSKSGLAQQQVSKPALAQQQVFKPALAQQQVSKPALAQQQVSKPALAQQQVSKPALTQQQVCTPGLAQQQVSKPGLAQQQASKPALAQQQASKPALAQQQASKPALVQHTDGKEVSLKAMRKSLPFNISTRNSPRTFDTRPYNPKNDGIAAVAPETTSASNEQSPLQVEKETVGKTATPRTSQLKELHNPDANCLQQVEKKPQDMPKSDNSIETAKSADTVNADHDSKNIFEKMKIPVTTSLPSDAANHLSTGSDTAVKSVGSDVIAKSVGSATNEVFVSTSSITTDMSGPRVFEVKIKNPRHLLDKPKHFSQSPDVSITPAHTVVDNSKTKVISYILRGPQQKLTQVTDEVISTEQLATSVIKVTRSGDALSPLSSPALSTEQAIKPTAPATRVTSYQVIDPSNLQRKQAIIPVPTSSTVKTSPLEQVKLVQQRIGPASKETPGQSGMALAAALTKSGHISSTSASSFILSHGQAGKYIIYTRPAGSKELTTVGSLIKPLDVSAQQASSSPPVTVANSSDSKPDSDSQEAAGEKTFLPGTFVIRKHYL